MGLDRLILIKVYFRLLQVKPLLQNISSAALRESNLFLEYGGLHLSSVDGRLRSHVHSERPAALTPQAIQLPFRWVKPSLFPTTSFTAINRSEAKVSRSCGRLSFLLIWVSR